MLDRLVGTRRIRQIQRALKNGKVTLLCLLMTLVVLHGTIGAGKLETPVQDFNEIRLHLSSRKSIEPHRALVEADNSNANINKQVVAVKEEEEEEAYEKPDPNKPYSFGPKISDWDKQRSQWLRKNPSWSNFVGAGKPRVLVTKLMKGMKMNQSSRGEGNQADSVF